VCQFPTGDPRQPDYRICGRAVERPGLPYCPVHTHSDRLSPKPPPAGAAPQERFPTREEALAAELAAIRTEAPIHNVRGKVQEKQPMTTLELQVKPEFRLRLKLAAIWADVREGQFVNRAILEMFPEPIKESPALGGA
jgi:hypothetical protein